jgi:hypothetical protein
MPARCRDPHPARHAADRSAKPSELAPCNRYDYPRVSASARRRQPAGRVQGAARRYCGCAPGGRRRPACRMVLRAAARRGRSRDFDRKKGVAMIPKSGSLAVFLVAPARREGHDDSPATRLLGAGGRLLLLAVAACSSAPPDATSWAHVQSVEVSDITVGPGACGEPQRLGVSDYVFSHLPSTSFSGSVTRDGCTLSVSVISGAGDAVQSCLDCWSGYAVEVQQ